MGAEQFSNTVKVEWSSVSDRNMILLEDITFTDSEGLEWSAYTGEMIDGASIPKVFWSILGSPFVGRYRRPSVIHDVYCKRQKKTRSAQAVHDMFHEAMLADGVPVMEAKAMFDAVNLFGPRW